MLERDLGLGEEVWTGNVGLMVNTQYEGLMDMTLEEYEQQQKYERDIQILSRLIGTTVCRKRDEVWDPTRHLFSTFYETMAIRKAMLEIRPTPQVKLEFAEKDLSTSIYTTIDDFDSLIGKVGQYGSIKEMLMSEGFSFGKL